MSSLSVTLATSLQCCTTGISLVRQGKVAFSLSANVAACLQKWQLVCCIGQLVCRFVCHLKPGVSNSLLDGKYGSMHRSAAPLYPALSCLTARNKEVQQQTVPCSRYSSILPGYDEVDCSLCVKPRMCSFDNLQRAYHTNVEKDQLQL